MAAGTGQQAGERLSLQHQASVGLVSSSVAGYVANIALGADPAAISTWYLSAAQGILSKISSGYATNRQSSLTYLQRHAAVNRAAVVPVPGSLDVSALAKRLEIVGPIGFKSAIAAGQDSETALRHMATQMSGVADEVSRNGDRDVITRTAQFGRGVVGWRRHLSGHACGFCAMLASRGSVYISRRSAVVPKQSDAYHPHCHCWAEPLYERQQEPAYVRDLQSQWRRVTAGKSGREAQVAWRQHWEQRATPAARAAHGIPEPALLRGTGEVPVPPAASPAAAGAGTARTLSDLPRVENPEDMLAQAMGTNPRYGQAYLGELPPGTIGPVSYSQNCTRVVIGYEMRRRGFEVTAGATTAIGDTTAAYVRTFRLDGRYATRVAEDLSRNMTAREIAAEVETWPMGARGIVTVQGHTLNVERDLVTGRAVFIDAQAASKKNPIMNVTGFQRRMASRGAPADRMAVARVDDLELSDYGMRYVESPELNLSDGFLGKTQYPLMPGTELQPRSFADLAKIKPDDTYLGGATLRGPPPSVGLRPTLVQASTTADVETVLRSELQRITGRSTIVELGSADPRTAREFAEGILRAQERYPAAPLARVALGNEGRLAPAVMERYGDTTSGQIMLDRALAADRSQLSAAIAELHEKGLVMSAETDAIWVVTHEFGHLVDEFAMAERSGMTFSVRRIADLVKEQMRSEGLDSSTSALREAYIRSALSEKAAQNALELTAEAFADVLLNGGAARPLSRLIMRAFDSEYAARYGSIGRTAGLLGPPRTVAQLRATVAEHGITVPAGLNKPALERLVADLERGVAPATARQTAVEAAGRAPAKVAKKAAAQDLTGVPGYMQRQAAVRDVLDLPGATETRLPGGERGGATLVTAPDGRRAVKKSFTRVDERDAEILGARIADAVEVRAGAVVRLDEKTLGIEYVPGRVAEIRADIPQSLLQSDEGRRMGLADVLMQNEDRRGNWVVMPDGQLGSIDHALSFGGIRDRFGNPRIAVTSSEFSDYIANLGSRRLRREIDLDPADLATIRSRIEALHPEFVSLGRQDWYEATLKILSEIETRAVGTRSILTAPIKAAVKKAAPAKVAVPKPPPVPARMTIPALRTELQPIIDAAPDISRFELAGVPKPTLAHWVERVRSLPESERPLEVARWQQVIADKRRALVDTLIEADELVANEASTRALAARAAARLRSAEAALQGWPELAEIRKVTAAMQTGDPVKIRRAIKASGKKLGLAQIGADAGQAARFERGSMSSLGGTRIPDGAHVVVVRPGYSVEMGGRRIVMSRPVVREATEAEIPRPSRSVPAIGQLMKTAGRRIAAGDHAAVGALQRQVVQALEGTYGSGLRAGDIDVAITRTGLHFDGKIFDAAGQKVGNFAREIYLDDSGDLIAQHGIMVLRPQVQGSGFATEFNDNLFDWYRRSGVKEVRLLADMAVGGYSWATKGFDFENAAAAADFLDAAETKIKRALAGRVPTAGVTKQDLLELQAYVRAIRQGEIPAHAPEIARFGHKPGQGGKSAIWPGKWLMVGSDWHGVLYL